MSLGKKFIQPPFLKAGDKVALVSPAYWVPEEAIMQAVEIIRSWGLQPVVGPHTTSLNVDAYAGTADERAHDLKWAYEDDSIKAIFCSRGGYGSIHLLNRVPKDYFSQYPKWLIGHHDTAQYGGWRGLDEYPWTYGIPDKYSAGACHEYSAQYTVWNHSPIQDTC